MDINKALNEIIFKYHLDRCYPHYRDMYKAEEILKNVINDIIHNNKKVIFVGNDKTGIEFIRNISRDCDCIYFMLCDKNKALAPQLEVIDWEDYEELYLISFYGAEYFEYWFRMHNIQCHWIYDIFEREGVFLQRDVFVFGKEDLFALICPGGIHTRYDITESIQCELFYQHSKFENVSDLKIKRIALEKCLFLSLYMRNFVLTKKYIFLLSEEDKIFKKIWKEITELLESIKKIINAGQQEDIILYWLDAVPYGDEKNMPYLQSIMQDSIVFENAFAYIANTHPVLREMFLGKKDTDNHTYNITEISQENSSLMRFLKEQGYDIRIISSYFNNNFPFQYVSEQFYIDWYVPSSIIFWDMLLNLIQQKQKTLYIIHVMDAHDPYLSSKIRMDNHMNKNKRYRLARKELDEQLAFYDAFINRDIYRIYMSDHGNKGSKRHHVLFNIYNKKLKARKIEGVFSFTDFETILRQMVINGEIKEGEFTKKYAEICRLDRYNYRGIKNVFAAKRELPLDYIGYKGIIDKEYVYIHYNTGKEWLQRRAFIPLCDPLLFYDCSSDICDVTLLPQYRTMTAEYQEDFIEDEKFKYSKYMYALYHNVLRHNNIHERVNVINQMLEDYSNNSVAIRTGGVTSSVLYYILSEENKRKIWGFIDIDEECLCSKLELPIISSDKIADLHNLGVKAIVLPSYTYLEMMREEVKAWPKSIDVLDIYDAFDRSCIGCQEDFYKMRGNDEDYDVGFPYSEI